MANYNQAPQLLSIGEKNQDCDVYKGFAQRNHLLEYGMMNCLGDRDFAMLKIMLFLTGNQANVGFKVAEETICQACNISPTAYKNNRKKLVTLGWIEHKDSKYVKVNYDKIYADIKQKLGLIENTPKIEVNSEYPNFIEQGVINNTPILEIVGEQGLIQNTPKKLGVINNTSILKQGITQNTPILDGVNLEYPNFNSQNTPLGVIQNTHNNIIEQNKQKDNIPSLSFSQIQEMFAEGSYEIQDEICYKDDGKRFRVVYDF